MEHTINLDPFIANPPTARDAHPGAPLVSVANQDTVTYEASQDFVIHDIQQHTRDPLRPPNPRKPNNPFYRVLPMAARRGAGNKFRVNSGPARSQAVGQRYRITFEVVATGAMIDPDIIIDA